MSDKLVMPGPITTMNMMGFQRLSQLPEEENQSQGEEGWNTGRGLRSQWPAVCFPGEEQKGQELDGVSPLGKHNNYFK